MSPTLSHPDFIFLDIPIHYLEHMDLKYKKTAVKINLVYIARIPALKDTQTIQWTQDSYP